jgi:NADH dehydrogenase
MSEIKTLTFNNRSAEKVVKIAILGSGFGAMHAALELRKLRRKLPKDIKFHVEMISKTDYFWLVTMAHEIATGNLLPDDVVQPVRSLPTTVYDNYIQATVQSIDATAGEVKMKLLDVVSSNAVEEDVVRQYDYIVSSLGSKTFYFGVNGAAEFALPVKTLDDVKQIKNRILQSFEDAELATEFDELKKLLHFIIVGGGATGVEVAAELADMINGPLSSRYPNVTKHSQVTIVHGGENLGVPGIDWMGSELQHILKDKHCVNVRLNSFVTKVSRDGVKIGEDFVPSYNVIWSGGVEASSVAVTTVNGEPERNRQGRIAVENDLSLGEHPNVFIIGDQAAVMNAAGQEYPMRAQFAVRQGQHAVKMIMADLQNRRRQPFEYEDKGVIIGLGDGKALAQAGGVKLKGRLAYLLYKLVYIPQIIGFRARFKTTTSWLMNLFTPRDLSKL